MSGITLEQAQARLQLYQDAEETVLTNQSYTIGERSFTRADLKDIQAGIALWERRVQSLSAAAGSSRGRARTVVVRG
jgi:hypothetical protein